MSTVKIKTESTTTAAAADVQVKLEPSLSTADIKLEQHTSDNDIKAEFDWDADSEESDEGDIKSEYDDASDDEDTDQYQFTVTPKNQPLLICKHPGCGRNFKKARYLKLHQHDHRLQIELYIYGRTYTLTRQSLNDRWLCPIPDCTSILMTASALCTHIRRKHTATTRQQQQEQQAPPKKARRRHYSIDVDDFYVNGVCCGYHTTVGVFICHECRLVPECLLTHLQQKHAFDEKAVDSSALLESAVNANANPNINQHVSNSHLAAAIRQPYWQPYWQHHRDIVQGWLCVTSECGYCGYAVHNKSKHKRNFHKGEKMSTVPVLVLRLCISKARTCYFLITRLDQASGAITTSSNRVNQHNLNCSHNGLRAQDENEDENGDDANQNDTTDISNQKRQYICEHNNCGRFFNSSNKLSAHRREHKLEVAVAVRGSTFTFSRQSADDRWPCPVPGCDVTCKSVGVTQIHIQKSHNTLVRQKRVNSEDNDDIQQRQIIKKKRPTIHYFNVDVFYVGDIRCGYHNATGVFLCHKCRLVPECLLSHLQQTHAFDEKSIDNAVLPESAKITGSDPKTNQHISNPILASAISQPHQWHQQDIIQGWCCIAANCGYCGCTSRAKNDHKKNIHRGDQLLMVPALVLRLVYMKTHSSCFLITRLDTITDNTIETTNSMSQHSSEGDDEEDDGDELVLSDYSDEDDIY